MFFCIYPISREKNIVSYWHEMKHITEKDFEKEDVQQIERDALNGTVKVIYKGFDGLNIRKASSMLAEIDQVVKSGTFTVVGISKDEKWYKLKSGLFITSIPDYVEFKAAPEQKAGTAGTGYYRVRKSWQDVISFHHFIAFAGKVNF